MAVEDHSSYAIPLNRDQTVMQMDLTLRPIIYRKNRRISAIFLHVELLEGYT
jgi:hypothetical protein